MELTRLIREENQNNRLRVRAREEVLYGRSDYPVEYDSMLQAESSPMETGQSSSFGLRFLVAVFLFAVYFICKTRGTDVMGITSEQIEMAVSGEDALSQILPVGNLTEWLADD